MIEIICVIVIIAMSLYFMWLNHNMEKDTQEFMKQQSIELKERLAVYRERCEVVKTEEEQHRKNVSDIKEMLREVINSRVNLKNYEPGNSR